MNLWHFSCRTIGLLGVQVRSLRTNRRGHSLPLAAGAGEPRRAGQLEEGAEAARHRGPSPPRHRADLPPTGGHVSAHLEKKRSKWRRPETLLFYFVVVVCFLALPDFLLVFFFFFGLVTNSTRWNTVYSGGDEIGFFASLPSSTDTFYFFLF